MMKIYQRTLQGLVLAGAMGATAAQAGIYVGLGIGQAAMDDSTTAGKVDESSLGWKVYGGNSQLTEHFGFELGWVDLGDMNESGVADVETEGFDFMATATYPLGDALSIYGKAGVLIWDQDVRMGATSSTDDGNDLVFGLGATYNINSLLDARVEWERFNTELDVDMFTVGIALRF